MDELILIDEQDNVVGHGEKLSVHRDGGRLHRAFSIFLYNSAGQLLLQLRSVRKYHFGGLWTNTCCGHPRRGELTVDAAQNRLRAEFGIQAALQEQFSFIYRAEHAASGLTEHELDHVFTGTFDGIPNPDPEEIDDWKWVDVAEVARDLAVQPERYSPWFPVAFSRLHPT